MIDIDWYKQEIISQQVTHLEEQSLLSPALSPTKLNHGEFPIDDVTRWELI